MRIITICCFLLVSFLANLSAQITIDIQDVSTCQNTVSVPIVILEDQILTSIQFTLVWDGRNGTGLSYSGVTDMIGVGSFFLGPNDPASGSPNEVDTLTYTWTQPVGHSFSAGDQLLTLDLNINTPGETYPVFFYPGPNPPSPIEATAPGFVFVTVTPLDGVVSSASNTPAFVDCPSDITIANVDGTCSNNVSWTDPTVVDCDNNANPPTNTFSPGDPFTIGTQLVTYTVTDGDGNVGTCTFNVTVTDGSSPDVTCPPNINQTIAAGTTYTATSAELMPTVTDCSNTTINYTLTGDTPGSGIYNGQDLTFNPGTTQVMYSVSDGINPPVLCDFTVVINQITGPGITLDIGDVTTSCGDDISVPIIILEDQVITTIEFTIIWGQPGLTFNNITNNLPGGTTDIGPFTAPPHNGGADTITYSYININSLALTAGQTLATLNFTPTGNTGDVIPVLFYPGTSHPDFPVPAEASDAGFIPILPVNTLNGSITIGTPDLFTIDCPTDINLTDTDGDCSEIATWNPPIVNDCNNNANLPTSNFDSGDAFAIGSQIVTYSVTDTDGNMATCSFTVNVADGASPDVTCPPNINQTIAAGTTYTATSAELMPTVTDCSNTTINYTLTGDTPGSGIYNGQDLTFNPGTTQVMYSVSDGINPPALCDFTVVINQITGPGITLDIGDVTTSCGDDISVPIIILEDQIITTIEFTIIWGQPGLTFNNITNNLPGGTTDIGPFTAPPHNGGADTITYSYININSLALTAGQTLATLNFTPTGNTGDVIPVLFYPGTSHPDFPVPAEASDAGFIPILPVNTLNGSITIGGSNEVVINCPGPITISCNDPITTTSTGMATAMDGCGVSLTPSISDVNNLSGCSNTGTITRTFTASDGNGNTNACTQLITVIDNTDPVFDANPVSIANIDCGTDLPTQQVLTATDNCGNVTVTPSIDPFSADACDGYTVTYRWTATDACNNSTEVTQSFNVNPDNTDPVFDTNPVSIANIDCGTDLPTQQVLTATDNCGNVTVTPSIDPFNSDQCAGYTITYRWTATDACGNSTEVTQAFEVNPDNTNPLFDVVPVSIANIDCGTDLPIQEVLTATDNCGNVMVIPSVDPFNSDQCDGYTITYRWTTTDACGTSTEVSQSFEVNPDNTNPVFDEVPTSIANIDCGTDLPTQQVLTATDNCGNVTVTPSVDPFNSDQCDGYTITYRWIATDDCGNSTEVSQSFEVNPDDINPNFTVPQDLIINCGDDPLDLSLTGDVTDESDNCDTGVSNNGPRSATFSDNIDLGECSSFYIRSWTLTDQCGNENIQTQSIQLLDSTNPVPLCQPNLDLFLDEDGAVTLDPETLDNGSTDNCSTTLTFSASQTSFSCADLGNQTIVLTVADACGNEATCDATVNIIDNTNPTLSCIPDITISTTNSSEIINDIALESSDDNCGISEINYILSGATTGMGMGDDASGNVFNTGQTIVTYTVTDNSGNSNSCSFNINLEGAVRIECPEAVTTNAVIENCDRTVENIGVTIISDPQDITTISYELSGATTGTGTDDASGSTFNVGLTQVTYTVMDVFGNSTACVFNVVIIDIENPEFMVACPEDIIGSVGPDCQQTINWNPPVATDNCPGVQLSSSHQPGASFGPGETIVTYNATDLVGNVNTCSFTITLSDDTSPTISCPDDIVTDSPDGNSVVVNDLNPLSLSDNCPGAMVTYNLTGALSGSGNDDVSGTAFPVGQTNITYTVTDAAGNTGTCDFTVIIQGALNISCPSDVTQDAGSDCTQIIDNIDVTINSDPNNITSVSYELNGATTGSGSNASGISFNIGSTTVTYTVVDNLDNTAICSFMVNIIDNTNPTISCPANITQNTTNGTPVTVTGIEPMATNDNCAVETISYNLTGATAGSGVNDASGTSFLVGQTTITYTITDAAGNENSCAFFIQINDQIINEDLIDCPENIILDVDSGLCNNTISEIALILLVNPNEIQSITWELSGATVENGTDQIENIAFNAGVTEITFNATSTNGNTDFCTFTVTINDNILPVISGPTTLEFSSDTDECGTVPEFNISISDNCEVAEISYELTGELNESGTGIPSNILFPPGNTTLTITATDGQNNSETFTTVVTVNDNINPIATCPEDIIISVDSGNCQATLGDIEGMKFDNCAVANDLYQISGATTATDLESLEGVMLNVGEHLISFEIVDVNGNTDACVFAITVEDNEAPILTCPANVFTNLTMGQTAVEVEDIDPVTATDLCSDFGVSYSVTGATSGNGTVSASGTEFNLGSSEVTYLITDAAGNTNSCSFMVSVGNLIVECPEDQELVIPIDACQVIVNDIAPTIPNTNLTITYEISGATTASGINDASGSTFNPGISTVVYTITDDSENQAFCSFMITALDEQAPVITCPDLPVFQTDQGACTAFIPMDLLQPTMNQDNCNPSLLVAFEITGSLVGSGSIDNIPLAYPTGTAFIIYTVSDQSGNSASCSFNLVVEDNISPTITCPDDIEISLPAGATSSQIDITNPVGSDNCAVAEVSYELSGVTTGSGTDNINDVEFQLGETVVTYTVTDPSGNSNTCAMMVTITQDVEIDLISCPIDQVSSTSPDICSVIVEDIAPVLLAPSSEIESILFSVTGATQVSGTNDASGTSFILGVSTVTYTATSVDQENQTICSFTVTILDQEAPVWTGCPLDITVSTSGENCSASVIWDEPVAMDNCGELLIEKDIEPGSIFQVGTTTFNYTATDESGNSSICVINVTVTDNTPPIPVDCPGDITITTDAEDCGAVYNFNLPSFTDICSDVTVISSHPSGDLLPVGATIVTFTATDDSQNSSTCSFTINVIDQTPPVLICTEDVIINGDGTILSDPNNIIQSTTPDGDCESVIIVFNDPSVMDNCSSPTITTIGPGSGDTFIGTTTVTFQATDAEGNPSLPCEFSVTILELPNIPVVVSPVNACAGSTVTLTADPVTGASYAWEGPNGFTATGNIVFIENLTLGDIGLYQVQVTLPSDCLISGEGMVNLAETPEITNLSSNGPLCVGDDLSFTITGNNLSLFEWNGPNDFSSSEPNPTIENTTSDMSGNYSVIVSSFDGCTTIQSISVQINGVPNTPSIQTDCEDFICLGESCLLVGTAFTSEATYLWNSEDDSAGLPIITNNNEIVITPTESGTYVYQYRVEVNGCISPVVEYTLMVDAGPEAVDDIVQVNYQGILENIRVLSNDVVTPGLGMSVNLLLTAENGNVTQNGGDTFTYTPNPDFIGIDEFTYQVCYVCSGSLICDEGVVSVNVSYTGDCDVPNVITPNGDNKNDVLFLPCITGGEFPDNQLTIYNQWGDEVFQQAPYQNQWDGTLEGKAGKDLPDGTYYFLFITEQNSKPIKGHITIYR